MARDGGLALALALCRERERALQIRTMRHICAWPQVRHFGLCGNMTGHIYMSARVRGPHANWLLLYSYKTDIIAAAITLRNARLLPLLPSTAVLCARLENAPPVSVRPAATAGQQLAAWQS